METFTQKKEKCYRCFACEKDMKRINSICPLKRVPVAELENLLLREISSMLAKPEIFAGKTWKPCKRLFGLYAKPVRKRRSEQASMSTSV